MARVAIYIARHLCTAPRGRKEADALAAAGHDVTVHGQWWDPQLIERDRALMQNRPWCFRPFADHRPGSGIRALRWWFYRLQCRAARELFLRTRAKFSPLLGYGVPALLRHARKERADLTIAHSEGSLWAINKLRAEGHRVGVDFEDWFSQDLPADKRRHRPVAWLEELEAAALRTCVYLTAPSLAVANAMQRAYGGSAPSVIYNTISSEHHATSPRESGPARLHWFSQTIGPGRGLENLFSALPDVSGDWTLHLRGEDPQRHGQHLLSTLPEGLRDHVEFLPTVSPGELTESTARFDVGLALEPSTSRNNDLTVSNKLFQYLHSGLAIIASATTGHREILEQVPEAGFVVPINDPSALATAINRLISDATQLGNARSAALAAAANFDQARQLDHYAALAARALAT
ncbi:glycosyltransferase [Actomonas aquatica]|uniref:Glycosyltransferase n=1 Tax=Actomonas aquatica TaxID=2866162 RepID=A0ABZ1CB57_9BACT|nr:glycosyltransferase [Opitutus sp. WL0086]WRQ88463.1 glycosyltransferase [Opitutus sp. WL0086]